MEKITHLHLFLMLALSAFFLGWAFFFAKAVARLSATHYHDFSAILECIALLTIFLIVAHGFINHIAAHPLFPFPANSESS